MPSLNYHIRFADMLRTGQKKQTVRATGKRKYKPGDRLYHFTGQRTKNCVKLGESVCTEVLPIKIWYEYIIVAGESLSVVERDNFAKADGFASISDFRRFLAKVHRLNRKPFYGRVIKWDIFIPE